LLGLLFKVRTNFEKFEYILYYILFSLTQVISTFEVTMTSSHPSSKYSIDPLVTKTANVGFIIYLGPLFLTIFLMFRSDLLLAKRLGYKVLRRDEVIRNYINLFITYFFVWATTFGLFTYTYPNVMFGHMIADFVLVVYNKILVPIKY